MPFVSNYVHGIIGGKPNAAAKKSPGEAWRCEFLDPKTGEQCSASGDTKRNSGVAPFRHDCRGHGAERGDFRRSHFACQRHWQQFMRVHAGSFGVTAIPLDPGMVGAGGARHSR